MQSKDIEEGERTNEPASTEQQSEPTPVLLPPPEPKMLKQVLPHCAPCLNMQFVKAPTRLDMAWSMC